ncbi:MAG: hypothetical protein FWB72_00300 [Firmicutes bacterium]|nr:hypothetical protein [Bacillota bacterium]
MENRGVTIAHSAYDVLWLFTFTIVFLVITLACYKGFSNKKGRMRNLPFLIITIFMIIFEIIKISRLLIIYGSDFNLRHLPFHISSYAMLTFALATFAKPDSRVSQIGFASSLSIQFVAGLALYVAPVAIVADSFTYIFTAQGSFYNHHTTIYHLIKVLFFMLAIALKPYAPNNRDIKWVFIIYASLLLISAVMAHLLNADFARFLDFPLNLPFIHDVHPFAKTAILYFVFMLVPVLGVLVMIVLPQKLRARSDAKVNA